MIPSGMIPEDTPANTADTAADTAAADTATADANTARRKPPAWLWACVIAVAVVALLAWPVGRRVPVAPGTTIQGDQLSQSVQLYQAGRYQEAADAAQAFLKINPNSAEAYNNLAVSYLGLKKYNEAISSAELALRLNPNFQLAKNNLAWIKQEQAKGGNGSPTPPAPGTVGFFVDQSLAHYRAGRYPECIDAARQALKLSPSSAVAENNIAACEGAQSHWDQAIAAAQEALRLAPDFQLARNNLNWALSQKARAGKP